MTARLVGVGGRRGVAPDPDPGPIALDAPPVPEEALRAAAGREPVRGDEVARARGLLDDPGWCRADLVAQALIEQTVEVLRFWRAPAHSEGGSAYTGP